MRQSQQSPIFAGTYRRSVAVVHASKIVKQCEPGQSEASILIKVLGTMSISTENTPSYSRAVRCTAGNVHFVSPVFIENIQLQGVK